MNANSPLNTPIVLKDNYGTPRELKRNDNASLHNLGDGVLCLEFHSKGNTLDTLIYEMGEVALDVLEGSAEYLAMVIGSQAKDFCLGANINQFLQAVALANGDVKLLEPVVGVLQELLMRLRFSAKPIVVAPYGRVLGGGAEVVMAGASVIAPANLRIGLVEVGVGVIPAGGGCKELLRRVVSPQAVNAHNDILPALKAVFERIAFAQVSENGQVAQQRGFLGSDDEIVSKADRLMDVAKQRVIALAEAGYAPPDRTTQNVWAAGRAGKAVLATSINQVQADGRFSAYDAHIAHTLAHVLCGGDLPVPQWVAEDDILALEREAFAQLLGEPKTQDRIAHMLKVAKPLRN